MSVAIMPPQVPPDFPARQLVEPAAAARGCTAAGRSHSPSLPTRAGVAAVRRTTTRCCSSPGCRRPRTRHPPPLDPARGLVGIDDRRGTPDRHRSLARGLRQLARQPVRIIESRSRSIRVPAVRTAAAFPELSVEDIASAAARRCARSVSRAWPASWDRRSGGMTVLAYCVAVPAHEVDALISISGGDGASAQAISLRSLQREIVRSDPELAQRRVRARARPADRSATRAQARHDHLPRRAASSARALRTASGSQSAARRTASGRSSRSSPISRTRRTFLADLRRELLPVTVARDGRVRSARSRRHARRGVRHDSARLRSLVIGVETDMLFPLHQQREIGSRSRRRRARR